MKNLQAAEMKDIKRIELTQAVNFYDQVYMLNIINDLNYIPKDYYYIVIYLEVEEFYHKGLKNSALYNNFMEDGFYEGKTKIKMIKKISCGSKVYLDKVKNKIKACIQ